MKVVNKLRRMSSLFEQINRLKFAKQKLQDFKCQIIALRAEAIRSNCKCNKLSSAIQLCRHKKRKLRPGEVSQLGIDEDLFVQESPEAQDGSETCFKPMHISDFKELQPVLDDIEFRIEQVKQTTLGGIKSI